VATVTRLVSGTLLAFALASGLAVGTAAQDEIGCEDVSAEEAQALLDQNPTYATRSLLDPDGDGVACEEDELAAAGAGAEAAQAATDGEDDDGNEDEGIGGGGRTAEDQGDDGGGRAAIAVNGLPATGVGAGAAPVAAPLLAVALGLAGLGGAVAARGARRA